MRQVIPLTYVIDIDPLNHESMKEASEYSDGTILYNTDTKHMIARARMMSNEKRETLIEQGYEELYCIKDRHTGRYKPVTSADCIVLFNGFQKEVIPKKLVKDMFENVSKHQEEIADEYAEEEEKPTPVLEY